MQSFPSLNTSDVASSRSNGRASRGDQRDEGLSVRRRRDDAGSQRGQRYGGRGVCVCVSVSGSAVVLSGVVGYCEVSPRGVR